MTQMLEPQAGESIYDPTCGTGGMLISALAEVKRSGGEHRTLKLYGQERNLMTSSIARMNLFLHGVEDFEIVRGDTLADPKHIEGDRLRQFDVILANPPYSIKQWNREAWSSRPLGPQLPRHAAAGPRRLRLPAAHPDQPHRQDRPLRRPLPHGVLFRNEEQEMRAKMVEPTGSRRHRPGPNLFYNSPMEACVVVCRTQRSRALRARAR
jgi:type I restriction enzyme M protein